MKITKFLLAILLITATSLFYVYQQTEIFRFAYEAQKKEALSQELLDKNTILRYNISRAASLVEIGDKFSGYTDFQIPDNYRLVRIERLRVKERPLRQQTLLSRIFGVKRQAEAEIINPP